MARPSWYDARGTEALVITLGATLPGSDSSIPDVGGAGDGEVLQERLMVAADAFTPENGDLIPTGQIRPVGDTDYDFRTPTELGSRLAAAGDPRVVASPIHPTIGSFPAPC